MQLHPSPCAHVCTTLPPGDLPMRDLYPGQPTGYMHMVSTCGAIRRVMIPQKVEKYPEAPIGAWAIHETRTDSNGDRWVNSPDGDYFVVDNYGDLVRVAAREGGAA